MSLTHCVLIHLRNLTQATYHAHHAHIYVSLVRYLVPHHHLLIQLLHVHLTLHLTVLLCGKRVCAEMWGYILSMKTTDRPSFLIYQGKPLHKCVEDNQQHVR